MDDRTRAWDHRAAGPDDRTIRPDDRTRPPPGARRPDERAILPDDRTRAWDHRAAGPDDRTIRPGDRMVGPDDRTRPPDDRTRSSGGWTTSSSGEWGPRRFQVGTQVGEFVLEQKLGQGGMGAVFVARRADGEQRVALKVLLVAQDELREDELERFRREGQAQAAVDAHPNVLRVITSGTHEGFPYLVTELAVGGDLKSRVKRGPMEPEAAARLALDLSRGLAHVHARGVLHRDLKPANVVFGEDDVPKLMDFGLARLAGARKLTQTGAAMGTAAYMAPEQAAGERLDERADVYGLGAILYECLTGRAPFEGTSDIGIIKQVLTDEVEPPRALRPEVPVDLDAIVVRALARAPEERYPSAAALGDDLARFLAGERPTATPKARRSRAVLAVGALVLLGAAGAAVVVARGPGEPAPAGPVAAAAPVEPEAALLDATEGELGAWRLAEAGTTSFSLRARVRGDVRLRVTPFEVRGVDERPRPSRPAELAAPAGDEVELAVPVQTGWQRLELVAAGARSTTPPLATLELIVLPEGLRLAPAHGPHAAVAREGSVLLLVPPGEVDFVGAADHRQRTPERREVFAPYFLGRTEVSWAQVEAYNARTGRDRFRPKLEHGGEMFEAPDDHPAVMIQAWQAEEYCLAHGLRLATDLEWEHAAQGVTEGNLNGASDGYRFTAPVDAALPMAGAVGRWGHLHLCGNVWEFVQRSSNDLAPNYGAAWTTTRRFRADDSLEFAAYSTGFRVALGLEVTERQTPTYRQMR